MVLEKVRQQGYAVNVGENEEYLKCITYPIFDAKHEIMAALSLTGVIQCFTQELDDSCHKALRRITAQVSQEFGAGII